ALKGMVFEQQRLSFDELLSVLKANFATPEGEKVRARLINRFEKYGNDIDEVDNISAELLRLLALQSWLLIPTAIRQNLNAVAQKP
ncbi:pyruvate formate lyase family protein, partial [Escherichia sp. TWPC-MK]